MSDGEEWRLLECVEGPAAERSSLFREVRERHPEIAGLSEDWLRVHVVCGRDGISRKRFMLRTRPPAGQRKKPRDLP